MQGMRDRVTEAMKDGESTINVNTEERSVSLTILAQPFREYFIRKVKAPFEKAIIIFSKKFPDPTERNTSGTWTAPFMDAFDKLVDYVNFKKGLFIAIRRIVICEMEHDGLYRDPIIAMLEWLIESILDGKLEGRGEMKPPRQYWSEPPPYGGKYSIINNIRANRREINDLLGRRTINE